MTLTSTSAPKQAATRLIRWAVARWADRYRAELATVHPATERAGTPVGITLVTFCGHRDVPQAGAMLRSFLEHAGTPRSVVVGSDGSITPEDADLLARLCAPVECTVAVPTVPSDVPNAALLAGYADAMALGKKLALLVTASSEGTGPTLFADSDVLFFPGAHDLPILFLEGAENRFMADPTRESFDHRVHLGPGPYANGGFLVMPEPPDWDGALAASTALLASPTHFVDQTVAHLAIQARGGRPLPADRYILRTDDAWSLRDHADAAGVVARHYVSPVRWKLWAAAFGGPARALWALVTPIRR
jgi:hypothetical protein